MLKKGTRDFIVDVAKAVWTLIKVLLIVTLLVLAVQLFALGGFVVAVKIVAISLQPSPDAILYPVYTYMVEYNERLRGLMPQLSMAWFFIVLLRFSFFPGDISLKKIKKSYSQLINAGKSGRKH
ncbi:TPA: hypothetical protein ACUA4C_004859 [Escherichia coli]